MLFGDGQQIAIQLRGEGQQIVALIGQRRDHRRQSSGTARLSSLQLPEDKVVQLLADRVTQAVHDQDVLAKPAGQQGHIVGQSDGLGLTPSCMP